MKKIDYQFLISQMLRQIGYLNVNIHNDKNKKLTSLKAVELGPLTHARYTHRTQR